jgi:hypothetical protein
MRHCVAAVAATRAAVLLLLLMMMMMMMTHAAPLAAAGADLTQLASGAVNFLLTTSAGGTLDLNRLTLNGVSVSW